MWQRLRFKMPLLLASGLVSLAFMTSAFAQTPGQYHGHRHHHHWQHRGADPMSRESRDMGLRSGMGVLCGT